MNAQQILKAGIGHMQDRAATYDKPEGERSMNATVNAFFVITGHALTEEQGWLFMALLEMVRSQQGAFRADSYEDGAAYFALAGEAAHQERLIDPQERDGWTHEAIQAAAFKSSENSGIPNYLVGGAGRHTEEVALADWPNELRRQDAEDVTIYPPEAPADSGSPWMEWNGGVRPVQSVTIIEVRMRDGETEEGLAGAFGWSHRGEPTDIVAWRETWPEARMDVIGQNGPTGEHYAEEGKPRSRHCKACRGPCELTV